jgi:hypothetical protein
VFSVVGCVSGSVAISFMGFGGGTMSGVTERFWCLEFNGHDVSGCVFYFL